MSGEYINNGQTGALGRDNQVQGNTFVQAREPVEGAIYLQELTTALAKVRAAAQAQAGPDDEPEVAALVAAEDAAKRGDGFELTRQLSRLGSFTLGTAEKIGVPVLTKLVERLLGL